MNIMVKGILEWIEGCPSCGGNHINLEFTVHWPIKLPDGFSYNISMFCPKNKKHILAR